MATKRFDTDAIDMDYLKQEFNRFRSELGNAKSKLGGNAADALDQITDYLNGNGLSSRIASLESEISALTERLKGTGKDAVIKLETQVGQRPLTSIAIAFGVGLLASQLLRRS
jgi:ElaB/YqjD/DUF883 family membrane-anchored ribosome-binding protein